MGIFRLDYLFILSPHSFSVIIPTVRLFDLVKIVQSGTTKSGTTNEKSLIPETYWNSLRATPFTST